MDQKNREILVNEGTGKFQVPNLNPWFFIRRQRCARSSKNKYGEHEPQGHHAEAHSGNKGSRPHGFFLL
jgi:hypothetical protein